jgi:hypothetical protein
VESRKTNCDSSGRISEQHKYRSAIVRTLPFPFLFDTAAENALADAPARLKKDLEKVLAIQADLDRIEETIHSATSIFGQGPHVAASLTQLNESHASLSAQVDDLYSSLNILDSFPSLKQLPFPVVHKLLLTRDLKVNIRKRAIGSFFEYDKLEQAAGGRNQALGLYSPFTSIPQYH